MKRDLNLIRNILLHLESLDTFQKPAQVNDFLFLSKDRNLIALQIELLRDSKFIESEHTSTIAGRNFIITRITNAGYDYLDSVRSDEIWEKVQGKLLKIGGNISLDIVSQLGREIIRATTGI